METRFDLGWWKYKKGVIMYFQRTKYFILNIKVEINLLCLPLQNILFFNNIEVIRRFNEILIRLNVWVKGKLPPSYHILYWKEFSRWKCLALGHLVYCIQLCGITSPLLLINCLVISHIYYQYVLYKKYYTGHIVC